MGVRSAQERPVEAEQKFSRCNLDQQQREEHLSGKLQIVNAPFHAAFLGVEIAVSRHLWCQMAVDDALGADHGQNEVDHALESVDPQERHTRFEMRGQFGSLGIGGFCWLHTFKTPPFIVSVECSISQFRILRLKRTLSEVVSY